SSTAVPPSPLPITNTPLPTETPIPTATLLPTATHHPTATPTQPPTATLSPTPLLTATPILSPTATPPPEDTPLPTAPPSPTQTDIPSTTNIPLNEIAAHMGEEIAIFGRVTAASSFSSGFKFTVDDGNGRVTLLMWSDVYDNCWDAPQLNVGATVQVTGEIGEYEGELQIAPDFGGDVKVITPGVASAPQRNIGDLGAHIDEQVTITGSIIRVEGTSAGAKLFIGDETGEVLIFVWQNILDRVPDNTSLGIPGTKVRVTGRVQIYRSNQEIIPVLPYDIEVLQ
ncbi:MAG: hypothetical protein GY796_28315, partial [Chloroflexi bacterium]|nr:hypothetical protein [Chloroflexota bacterium]